MNNKGFTMIELIATIGIMVLIGLILVNNMSGLFSEQEDKDYEVFIKKIEDAACMYVETAFSKEERNNCKQNSNGCVIIVDQLITRGYIEDSLMDPKTEEKIVEKKEKYKVNVKWIDNVKTCKING